MKQENENNENNEDYFKSSTVALVLIGLVLAAGGIILLMYAASELYWELSPNKRVTVEPIGSDFKSLKIVNKTTGEEVEAYSTNGYGFRYYSFSVSETKHKNKTCIALKAYGRKSDTPIEKCFDTKGSSKLSLDDVQLALKPRRVINFTPTFNNNLSCRIYVIREGNKRTFPTLSFHCEQKYN